MAQFLLSGKYQIRKAVKLNKKYFVKLTNKQRQHLEKLISSGIAPARTITRAHILLKSDCSPDGPDWTYARTSEAFNVTDVTISKICKRFVESGFEAAHYRKKPDREYKRRSCCWCLGSIYWLKSK